MDREQARRTLIQGLEKTVVAGVAWNGPYLVDILNHKRFVAGEVNTQFLGDEFANWKGLVRSETTITPPPVSDCADARLSPWIVFGEQGGKVGVAPTKKTSAAAGHDVDYDFAAGGPLISEYPGKVLKVLIKTGQSVDKGQIVVVCESMKMEFSYSAPKATKVKSVGVKEGDIIAAGALLVDWEDEAS
jgi:acetyl/propionyl-CoA carboxylase alpha subunit